MKFDFSKLNYKKLTPYLFLAGVVLSLMASMITASVSNIDFAGVFIYSVALVALLFYRFNNGIIALLFGDFGKSMFKKYRYERKMKTFINQAEEIKKETCYGEKSIIVRRKNTNSFYQIVKRKNSFYIKKCSSLSKSSMITDFDSNKSYKGKKNVELMFHTIKELWYTVDADDETVIYMTNGKRKFPMVPEFPIDKETLEEFLCFDGIQKEQLFNAPKEEEIQKEKNSYKESFYFNVIVLLGAVFTTQCIPVPQKSFWFALCSLSSALCIGYLSVVSFLKPERFFYHEFFKQNSRKEGWEKKHILILAFAVLPALMVSVINITTLFSISALVFGIALIILFPKLIKKKKNDSKGVKVHIACVCIMLAFTSVICTMNINNIYIKDAENKMYNVSYSGDDNTVYVAIDNTDYPIKVSPEEYDETIPHISATRVKGLLGIEYII